MATSIEGITGATAAAVIAGDIDVALVNSILPQFSEKVLRQAMPKLVHLQFAERQNELANAKGDTIKFHRMGPLKPGGRLQEGVPIKSVTIDHSLVTISVGELGNKVTVTERLTRSTVLNVLQAKTDQLADDYALVTEVEQVRLLESLPSTIYANGKANRAALNTTTDVMSTLTIRLAVQRFANNNIPRIRLFRIVGQGRDANIEYTGEEVYVCFLTHKQARNLREDAEWKDSHKVGDASVRYIYYGECGMYEGTIFIETNMQPIIQATSGDYLIGNMNYSDTDVVKDPFTADADPLAVDIHVAYFIGRNLWGFAEGDTVELRTEVPQDLGRIQGMGWVAWQGQGFLNEDHGTRIETV